MRPTRFSNGTPQAANSARMFGTSRAMPTPRMNRPSDTWSSVATWCASSTGLRSAGSSTAVPSATRGTRPATPASRVSGSCRGRASTESPDPDRVVAQRLGARGQLQQRRGIRLALHDLLARRQQVSDPRRHLRPPGYVRKLSIAASSASRPRRNAGSFGRVPTKPSFASSRPPARLTLAQPMMS